jgi:hypothetical protein
MFQVMDLPQSGMESLLNLTALMPVELVLGMQFVAMRAI